MSTSDSVADHVGEIGDRVGGEIGPLCLLPLPLFAGGNSRLTLRAHTPKASAPTNVGEVTDLAWRPSGHFERTLTRVFIASFSS